MFFFKAARNDMATFTKKKYLGKDGYQTVSI
jgi:hypothetical protein